MLIDYIINHKFDFIIKFQYNQAIRKKYSISWELTQEQLCFSEKTMAFAYQKQEEDDMEKITLDVKGVNKGHYTPGILSNGLLFISGQLSLDLDNLVFLCYLVHCSNEWYRHGLGAAAEDCPFRNDLLPGRQRYPRLQHRQGTGAGWGLWPSDRDRRNRSRLLSTV